jgi:3'-phosphoadenosine 5'-phosphosulfate sulfotransferase (PAPS reductase)/FAD synthetase
MKHVVGFSGGADSQACALWVRERFPAEDIILLNCDPGGNESVITEAFIRHYSETIFPVTTIRPIVADMNGKEPGAVARLGLSPSDPLTFDLLAKIKGRFPASAAQFCTTHLKLFPKARWIRENKDGLLAGGFENYIGVRRDESNDRAAVPDREIDDVCTWAMDRPVWLNRPIAGWAKDEVFSYLKAHGEDTNPLYKMGFSRVGCFPCINNKKEEIRLLAARAPEAIEKLRRWEASTGKTFFSTIMPGGRYGFIDEVVEWARTTHGGKQYSLPLLEADVESGMCMSKYGLCE